jgi:YVTN family beta-propeller protein
VQAIGIDAGSYNQKALLSITGQARVVVFNAAASLAYILDSGANLVRVYDAATHTFVGALTTGANPYQLAFVGSKAYVSNYDAGTVSVIDVTTNVGTTVNVGINPVGVQAYGTKVYVANYGSGTVSVIDTANGNLVTSITTGGNPFDIAINDTGSTAYVTDRLSGNVYVIDTATNQVTKTIVVGSDHTGIAVNVGTTSQLYVSNYADATMSMVLV